MGTQITTITPAAIDTELRSLVETVSTAKFQAAKLVQQMDELRGWKDLGFKTKKDWLANVLPEGVSRSLVYEAVKQLGAYPEIPLTELERIPKRNLEMMELLPERKRKDPEVLREAQGKPEDFAKYLNTAYSLSVSVGKTVSLWYEDSEEAEEVIRGLDNYVSIDTENAPSRSQAVRVLLGKAGLI
jgi:hypothetical protein